MPLQRGPVIYIALIVLWLLIAVSRGVQMIGNPARWVDVLLLIACGMLAGVNIVRARHAGRTTETSPPEIPGGPPNIPK